MVPRRILAEDSDQGLPEEAPPKSYSRPGPAASSDAVQATPPSARDLANDCAPAGASQTNMNSNYRESNNEMALH